MTSPLPYLDRLTITMDEKPSMDDLPSSIANEVFNSSTCIYPKLIEMDAILWISYITKVYVMPVLAVFGFVGNCLSFVVLSKEMRPTSTTVFLKALAVADNAVLIIYLLYFSFSSVYVFTGRLLPYFKLFEKTKSFSWALLWFTKVISVYVVVCVTVERFIAVCRPHRARTWCKVRNAKIVVGCICLSSFVYNMPKCLLFKTLMMYDPCLKESVPVAVSTALGNNQYFNTLYKVILYILLVFIIPLTTILVLNYQLIKAIKRGNRSNNRHKKRQASYDAITKRVVAVCCVFTILELPAVVMNVLELCAFVEGLVNGQRLLQMVSKTATGLLHLSYMFSTLNSCVNFYIYFLTGNGFRRTLKWMVFGQSNRVDIGADMSSTVRLSETTL
ncbi:FMRFamide receptor-like [Lineus longissimus]|uniref:FMRFamide receptor-like n=1 Tax=Lineus longissimus TaxID=88925 RepID=UPI00315C9D9C